MLQIKKLNLTHKKDLRIILNDFNLVLNDGDKAVIIGEEGNGKSTLMKWIYNLRKLKKGRMSQCMFLSSCWDSIAVQMMRRL